MDREATQSVRIEALSGNLNVARAEAAAQDFQAGLSGFDRGDYAQALREWIPLADQGHATAQANLGFMYSRGLGVAQDYTSAHMWLNIAAANGDEQARARRDEVARSMTPVDISEAQRRARVCMTSNYRDCD